MKARGAVWSIISLSLAVGLVACQAAVPQSGNGASQDSQVGPSFGQSAAGSVPSLTDNASQIRVSGCTATFAGSAVVGTFTPAPIGTPRAQRVSIDPSLQGRLAAYGDGVFTLLAPFGWTCYAFDGTEDGFAVVSSPDRQAYVRLEVSTDPASSLFGACAFFASAQRLQGSACSNDMEPTDQVRRALTPNLVEFTDPLGGEPVSVVGDQSGYESRGLVWFDPTSSGSKYTEIICEVSPANQDLCGPILDYFRATLPAPAAAATPAELASFAPTSPPTPEPISTRAGDCAVRLNGANATVVVRGAGAAACTAAKHALLGIGVFYTIDTTTATKGVYLVCSGPVMGLSGVVEVWDSGGAIWGTSVCLGWNLVAP